MTDVEKKVDMSLDELVAMRQKEAKKKAKKPAKKATARGAARLTRRLTQASRGASREPLSGMRAVRVVSPAIRVPAEAVALGLD